MMGMGEPLTESEKTFVPAMELMLEDFGFLVYTKRSRYLVDLGRSART